MYTNYKILHRELHRKSNKNRDTYFLDEIRNIPRTNGRNTSISIRTTATGNN